MKCNYLHKYIIKYKNKLANYKNVIVIQSYGKKLQIDFIHH